MVTVQDIFVRPILGFRGKETIEVCLKDSGGGLATSKIPFGVSEGKYEAVYCSPQEAVSRAKEQVLPLIKGMALGDQKAFDTKLIDYDGTPQKEKLGGNLMIGASIAYARLSSAAQGLALHEYLAASAGNKPSYHAPRILCNIIEGGLHAENDLEFQEHLIIPHADAIIKGIAMIKEYSALLIGELKKMGKALVFGDEGGLACLFGTEESVIQLLDEVRQQCAGEFGFGLDVAASNVKAFEPKAYTARYAKLVQQYPLEYFEDPFPEQGFETYYQDLYQLVQSKAIIVGDDLVATNPAKIKYFTGKQAIDGVIIKPDQVGTITETIESARLAKENKWKIIVAHRALETIDDYLADLAIGLGADFVKFGCFYQGERLAKYNRLLAIEKKECV